MGRGGNSDETGGASLRGDHAASAASLKTEWMGNELHHDAAGRAHNDSGPAAVYASGLVVWARHGVITRDPSEGPAVIRPDGSEEFWVDGSRVNSDR